MDEREMETMPDPEEWDFEHAERRPPVKNPRAVVSVAFAREDFEKVSRCAEQVGKRTSEFIREAAMEKVRHHHPLTVIFAFSGTLGTSLCTRTNPATTRRTGRTSWVKNRELALTV